jgi:AcrR family transcriptional regulator
VSEKTVFNYFPSKESLILDRLDATVASLRTGLADPAVSPVQAALGILDAELGAMTSWLAAQDDPVQAGAGILRAPGAPVGPPAPAPRARVLPQETP